MPTTDELIIKITGDVKGFKDASDKVANGVNRMADGVQNFGIKFGLMMNGLVMAAGYINNLTDTYYKQEVAEAKLTAAMKNVKTASADAADELMKQAAALQKLTTYGDEEIINAQAMLGTFQLNEDQIKAITPRLLDMAAASQTAGKADADLQSIAIALGKGFTGQAGQLSRYGVVLDDAAIEAEGFAGIIKSLDDNFKGMAETVAQTSAGAMKQFQNVMSDVKQELGKTISIGITPFIKILITLLELFNSLPSIIKRIATSLGILSIAFVAFIKVLNMTMTTAGTLTGVLAALAAAIYLTNTLLDGLERKQKKVAKTEWIEANNEQIEIWADRLNQTAVAMEVMEDKGSPAYKSLEKRAEALRNAIKKTSDQTRGYSTLEIPKQVDAIQNALIPATKDATQATKDYGDELENIIIQTPKVAYRVMQIASAFDTKLFNALKSSRVQFNEWDKQTLNNVKRVVDFTYSGFDRIATVMVDKMNGVKIRWSDIFTDMLHAFERMIVQMIAKAAALGVLKWLFGGATGGLGFLFSQAIGLGEGGLLVHKAQKGLLVKQPTLVYAGEGKEDELVIPLSKFFEALEMSKPNVRITSSDPNTTVDYYNEWSRGAQDRFFREFIKPAQRREDKR